MRLVQGTRLTSAIPAVPTGKPVVQRLLASGKPVTILDKLFYPDELDSLSSSLSHPRSYTSKSPLLKVHIGDIRNTTLLSEIFTSDVVGVVHLAAVSRVLWCLENEADCWDVNQRGTQLVLDALTNLNAKDSGKRWFVLASSREVYGNPLHDKPTTEDMERKPANVYGASKLAAEHVVTKHLDALNTRRAPGTLRVIALRLSNIYGGVYDHLERLIPSITTQALSHQVIQISGGQQNVSCHSNRGETHLSNSLWDSDPPYIILFLFSLTWCTSTTVSRRSC